MGSNVVNIVKELKKKQKKILKTLMHTFIKAWFLQYLKVICVMKAKRLSNNNIPLHLLAKNRGAKLGWGKLQSVYASKV